MEEQNTCSHSPGNGHSDTLLSLWVAMAQFSSSFFFVYSFRLEAIVECIVQVTRSLQMHGSNWYRWDFLSMLHSLVCLTGKNSGDAHSALFCLTGIYDCDFTIPISPGRCRPIIIHCAPFYNAVSLNEYILMTRRGIWPWLYGIEQRGFAHFAAASNSDCYGDTYQYSD